VIQSDGKIVLAGAFTDFNGQANLDYIARLNTNGTRDTNFAPSVAFSVFTRPVALQSDGKIVIGGNFTDYDSPMPQN
jgi:hypothetical protein